MNAGECWYYKNMVHIDHNYVGVYKQWTGLLDSLLTSHANIPTPLVTSQSSTWIIIIANLLLTNDIHEVLRPVLSMVYKSVIGNVV